MMKERLMRLWSLSPLATTVIHLNESSDTKVQTVKYGPDGQPAEYRPELKQVIVPTGASAIITNAVVTSQIDDYRGTEPDGVDRTGHTSGAMVSAHGLKVALDAQKCAVVVLGLGTVTHEGD